MQLEYTYVNQMDSKKLKKNYQKKRERFLKIKKALYLCATF